MRRSTAKKPRRRSGEDIGRDDGASRQPIALGTGGSSIPKSKRPGGSGGSWGDAQPA
jgi:cell division protease FtsH